MGPLNALGIDERLSFSEPTAPPPPIHPRRDLVPRPDVIAILR